MSILSNHYLEMAKLALDVLQHIKFVNDNGEISFALKGGTAINFFVTPLNRLSIDLDLTYCKINDRNTALDDINNELKRLEYIIKKEIPVKTTLTKGSVCGKLFVSNNYAKIKVEPNFILRGTVFPPQKLYIHDKAQDLFGKKISSYILNIPELFSGKFCAALDRQHPRDIFDMKSVVDDDNLLEKMRLPFIVNLLSHNRPVHEILDPNLQDINNLYFNEFEGMTISPIQINEMEDIRKKYTSLIFEYFSDDEMNFILSFVKNEPNWNILDFPEHVPDMPGILWKQYNLKKLKTENPEKYHLQISKLETLFENFTPRNDMSPTP